MADTEQEQAKGTAGFLLEMGMLKRATQRRQPSSDSGTTRRRPASATSRTSAGATSKPPATRWSPQTRCRPRTPQ